MFQGLIGIRLAVQTLLIINNCPEIVYFKNDCKVIYKIMARVLVKLPKSLGTVKGYKIFLLIT